MRTTNGSSVPRLFLLIAAAAVSGGCARQTELGSPQVSSAAGAAEPAFVAVAVSPLSKDTPLQAVAMFSYEPNEALTAPATDLAAFVSRARTAESFGQEPMKTLVLDPAPAPTKARRLLYVALGRRSEFTLDRVRAAGATTMRVTIAMKVPEMAFAPVVRDQGVTTFGADDVAEAFVEGALVEYIQERRAQPDAVIALQRVTYEAGAQYVASVTMAVARGVDSAHRRSAPPASP